MCNRMFHGDLFGNVSQAHFNRLEEQEDDLFEKADEEFSNAVDYSQKGGCYC